MGGGGGGGGGVMIEGGKNGSKQEVIKEPSASYKNVAKHATSRYM